MTHTPGPWRVRCVVDRGRDLEGTDKCFRIAAGTESWRENMVVALSFDRDYGYPEGGIQNEANARLIAAAPELLEACRLVVAWLTSFSMPPTSTIAEKQEHLAILDAAIAKAEGVKP